WNEAAFLQQQHDYVLNRVTNIGQKLIFIDESGFNSQTHPSHGYSLTGKFFISFFLTGCRFENKCKRFNDKSYHCPTESIIVMDNTRIHGGEYFDCIQMLLKESSKKIGIDFLPKYSPFLNPIKLVFNIIKIDVKHKEIQSRSGLAEAIRESINDKMTPCSHMQPITGNIIKDPEFFLQVS
ncbi:hypothetical protein VP01_2012g2, partial [Puccinia sorghi]